jgi:uncharacterized membrane protein
MVETSSQVKEEKNYSELDEKAANVKALDRLLGITDDIFAFAITLLVLDLATPIVLGAVTNISVLKAVESQYLAFLNYFVSFWVIGMHWLGHQRTFRYIKSSNMGLQVLNLAFLFFIVLIPFGTHVLNNYETTQTGIAIFALLQVAASVMSPIIWRYASSNHLIDERVSGRIRKWLSVRGFVLATIFLISIFLGFISPSLAIATGFLVAPAHTALDRKYWK